MIMKKIIYSLAVVASMMTFSSCLGDLDTLPLNETDKTAEQAYDGTLRSYEKGLAYIYGSFSLVSQNDPGSSDIAVPDAGQSDLLRQYMILNEASTDALNCIWGDSYMTGIQYNTWTAADNEAIIAVYTRCMISVTRANEFLVQTSGANVDGIAGLRAEARLLRAFAYYLLIDLYGNPPFATEENIAGDAPTQIGRPALFEWIESELKELASSSSDLPATNEYPRVNKGVAQALLTRLYLNAEVYTGTARWADARDAAAATIAMNYKLCSNYEELFMQDNGENSNSRQELIFSIAYDRDFTQSWGGTTHLVSGSLYDDANSGIAAALELSAGSLLSREHWGGYHVSDEYVQNFELKGVEWGTKKGDAGFGYDREASDKRAFFYNIEHEQAFNTSAQASGWVCWKYNSRDSKGSVYSSDRYEKFSSSDFPVIRLAEMYMAYAEAVTRLDGGTTTNATAIGYVKALRDRAGVDTPESLSLDFLLKERAREFMWEGHRRTDLIRYGYFTAMSFPWPYKGNIPDGKVALANWRTLYPIIRTEITENPNLVQNPGYN